MESILAVGGLWLYLRGNALALWRRIAVSTLSILMVTMTIIGMTVVPPPPGAMQIAASSLISILAIVALFTWFDSKRPRTN